MFPLSSSATVIVLNIDQRLKLDLYGQIEVWFIISQPLG